MFGAAVWRKVAEAEAALEALAADEGAASAAWLLSRAEAASSSIIESVRPSARGLAAAEAGLSIAGDEPFWDDEEPYGPELETLRHASATDAALAIGDTNKAVTVDDICDIHRVLMGSNPIAGQLRERQNWIGLPWSTPMDAAFVPSPPEMVPELMADLAERVNRPAPAAPLVDAAITHAQFETVHPFGDGNGRTGRALIQLMLRRSGPALACIPQVSMSLAVRRDFYIGALIRSRAICSPDRPERSEAQTEWIALFADAVTDGAVIAQRIIAHVGAIQDDWQHQLGSLGARPSSAAARLAGLLLSHPIVNVNTAAELLATNKRTTHRALNLLAEAGVIVQTSTGTRNRVFEASAIMDLLSTLVSLKVPGPLPPATPPQPPRA